jgi:hypothetical protein
MLFPLLLLGVALELMFLSALAGPGYGVLYGGGLGMYSLQGPLPLPQSPPGTDHPGAAVLLLNTSGAVGVAHGNQHHGPTVGEPLREPIIGVGVRPGPDWKWWDQGESQKGMTIDGVESSPGWVEVRWDTDTSNAYRVGAEGAYDLVVTSLTGAHLGSTTSNPSASLAQDRRHCPDHAHVECGYAGISREDCEKRGCCFDLESPIHCFPMAGTTTTAITPMPGTTTSPLPLDTSNIVGTGNLKCSACQCKINVPTLYPPPCGVKSSHAAEGVRDCTPNVPYQPGAHGPLADVFEDSCFLGDRHFLSVDELGKRAKSCLSPKHGAAGSPKNAFFLVGDSHAASLVPGMKAAVQGKLSFHWLAINAGMCWCGYLPFNPAHCQEPNAFFKERTCRGFNEYSKFQLEDNVRAGDVVAVAHYDHWTGLPPIPKDQVLPIEQYAAHLQELQRMVVGRGASLLLIGDVPMLPAPGPQCVPTPFDQSAFRKCEVPVAEEVNRHEHQNKVLTILGSQPLTYFFNFHNLLCTSQVCGAFVPGTDILAYRDVMHLTQSGSLYLSPFICAFLTQHSLMKLPSKYAQR